MGAEHGGPVEHPAQQRLDAATPNGLYSGKLFTSPVCYSLILAVRPWGQRFLPYPAGLHAKPVFHSRAFR